VEQWRGSGQSAAIFARRTGLNANTLRWWACQLGSTAKARGRFVEVVLGAPATESRIEVVLRGGLSIRVTGAFDPDVLRRVVATLGDR